MVPSNAFAGGLWIGDHMQLSFRFSALLTSLYEQRLGLARLRGLSLQSMCCRGTVGKLCFGESDWLLMLIRLGW